MMVAVLVKSDRARFAAGGLARVFFIALVFMLAACDTPVPTPTEPPSLIVQVQEVVATVQLTATQTPTLVMANSSTPIPFVYATPTLPETSTLTPTRPPTPRPTVVRPTSTPTFAQRCASLVAQTARTVYVMYINPTPELIWDKTPRQFLVGLCNTFPRAVAVPQGKYRIVLSFPGSGHGSTESNPPTTAELAPGFNEVSVGPWVPGLENHLSHCAARAVAQTRVMYNDTDDRNYRALQWADGSDHVPLPIKCGGNYP